MNFEDVQTVIEIRLPMMTVIPVMTCESSLMFRVGKVTCLGDLFYNVARKTAPDNRCSIKVATTIS